MSAKTSKSDEETKPGDFVPGDLVLVQFTKAKIWPGRIAKPTEVSEAIIQSQKEGQDFLIYYFGSKNYSWVKPTQLERWGVEEHQIEDAKKKNRNKAKVFDQGLEEAKEWAESDHVFPLYHDEADKEEVPKANEKKRRAKEVEEEAPTPKRRGRPPSMPMPDEDYLSSSDEDAPYKTPYPDEKKATRVRVMRKLGLYPPEGSLFKAVPAPATASTSSP